MIRIGILRLNSTHSTKSLFDAEKDELAYKDICENPILKIHTISHKIKVHKGIAKLSLKLSHNLSRDYITVGICHNVFRARKALMKNDCRKILNHTWITYLMLHCCLS